MVTNPKLKASLSIFIFLIKKGLAQKLLSRSCFIKFIIQILMNIQPELLKVRLEDHDYYTE